MQYQALENAVHSYIYFLLQSQEQECNRKYNQCLGARKGRGGMARYIKVMSTKVASYCLSLRYQGSVGVQYITLNFLVQEGYNRSA